MAITRDHIEQLLISVFLGDRSLESSNLHLFEKEISAISSQIFSRSVRELGNEKRISHEKLLPVAKHIQQIAQGYTNERKNTIPPLSLSACTAYTLYYFLINLEKIKRILSLYPKSYSSPSLRVLDYGAGPGTASFALSLLRSTPFDLTAVDNNSEMRTIASLLLKTLSPKYLSNYSVISPEDLSGSNYDLIIAAHVCNELPFEQQQTLTSSLLKKLSTNGSLLIIESALKEQTKELMRIRDYLLAQDNSLSIIFPCTHNAPCPMLRNSPDDWCHGYARWNAPFLVQQLDQHTGFNKHRIKYSALFLSRNSEIVAHIEHSYRVVKPPEQTKVGHTQTLCGSDYYGETLCRKRDRAEENIEFRRADLFDLLNISPTKESHDTLSKDSSVTRQKAP